MTVSRAPMRAADPGRQGDQQRQAWPEKAMSVDAAAAVLGGRAERDVSLAPFTTYRLGGPAALLVRARSVDDLAAVAAARAASGLPVVVVGRGSNLLVADEGFAGIAVLATALGGDLQVPPPGSGTSDVLGGSGLALPVVARRLAAAGWRGFEWAVGVPGSLGGAVRMNAGGHGSDMASCLVAAHIFDVAAGTSGWRTVDALGLRFRASNLTALDVVVEVSLRVHAGDRAAAEAEIAEIVRWRRENQPGGQNAGSVFVNPVPGEVSAGLLIDQLQLRGLRIGTAWVSEKHANFIQASDGGSAHDVRALIELVRRRVAEATGVELRSEVRMVGFGDDQ
jgi:UDP-N-acetylmuramate dehydrogenase